MTLLIAGYHSMRIIQKKIVTKCSECGKQIESNLSRIKKYCSIKCRNKNRKGSNGGMWKGGQQKYNCQYCGETFKAWPSQSIIYCSKECSQKFQKGKPKHLLGKLDEQGQNEGCRFPAAWFWERGGGK